MRRLLVALIATSTVLLGTRYARLTVAELYEDADFVALVQVTKAEVLGTGAQSCGALYTGHVVERFKGAAVEAIEFGHDQGLWFGAEYLVFLTKPGQSHRALLSTNSVSERLLAEQRARCQDLRTGWEIMHSGLAALLSMPADEPDYKLSFAVPSSYITFPESVPSTPANLGSMYEFHDMHFIERGAALDALRKIASTGE